MSLCDAQTLQATMSSEFSVDCVCMPASKTPRHEEIRREHEEIEERTIRWSWRPACGPIAIPGTDTNLTAVASGAWEGPHFAGCVWKELALEEHAYRTRVMALGQYLCLAVLRRSVLLRFWPKRANVWISCAQQSCTALLLSFIQRCVFLASSSSTKSASVSWTFA